MIKTSKVVLRLPKEADADLLLKWENDPENASYSSNPQGFTRTDILQFIDENIHVQDTNQQRLMICSLKEDIVLGAIDLYAIDFNNKTAGIGILVDKSFRRKGAALHALSAIENYASNNLGLSTLFCEIEKSNNASVNLFEKAKYEKIELRKKHYTIQSVPVDVYFYKKKI